MTTALDRKLLAAVDRLARAVRAARRTVATRHDLSLLGVDILETLRDRRERRVGELAAELDIAQPTVSDALSPLDGRGLLVRRRDPADRRSVVVTLSDAGLDLAHRIASDVALHPGVDETTSATDRGIALRVLLEEIARLQAAGVITVNRSCLTCRHYRPPQSRSTAHCLLLDTPLPDDDLRVDCDEHETAPVPA